jgi:hypothetical protein
MRLPKPLARKLDRLAWAAHAFHRYAHHPLCDEYRGEVIRLGRRGRVCRGCAFVATGTGIGLAAGFLLAPALPAVGMFALCALFAMNVLGRGGRPGKWRTRLLPALGLALVAGAGLRAASPAGAAAAGIAVAIYARIALAYRRRGPDRMPCVTCPERLLPVPCRGMRPIVRRERAFQRIAGRMIERSL